MFQTVAKSSYVRSGPAIKTVCVFRVRSAPISGQNRHILSLVFDDFDGERFLSTGTMVLTDFTKLPRLSTKFKNAAPVDKSWHRSVRKYAFYSSFESESCVFLVHVQ